MMLAYGIATGVILAKAFVFLIALVLACIAFSGIARKANWVYYLTFTPATRRWMERKQRYWVAFIPLYFVAASQALAAQSWMFLIWTYPGQF